jgi:hypothetical protein
MILIFVLYHCNNIFKKPVLPNYFNPTLLSHYINIIPKAAVLFNFI